MPKILTNIALTFVVLAVFFAPFSIVLAETRGQGASNDSQSSQVNYDIDDKTNAEYRANLEARVEAKKAQAQSLLNQSKENLIKNKCKSAQSLIIQLSEKASSAKSSRDEIYNNMTKNAEKLSERLKSNGQDTTKLDANIAELNNLIDKFKTDLKDMRQLAQDITEMDCEADPSGFSVLLEELRTSRDLVAQDSTAIRSYISDVLRPTLQDIRNLIGQLNQQTQEVQDGAQ